MVGSGRGLFWTMGQKRLTTCEISPAATPAMRRGVRELWLLHVARPDDLPMLASFAGAPADVQRNCRGREPCCEGMSKLALDCVRMPADSRVKRNALSPRMKSLGHGGHGSITSPKRW